MATSRLARRFQRQAGPLDCRTWRSHSLRHVRDLSPIGQLTSLVDLEVGGDWMAPRVVHVDSIEFLLGMPQLRRLVLHTLIVDSKDYSPLLGLVRLKELRVMPSKGMRPSHDELAAAIPALDPLPSRHG